MNKARLAEQYDFMVSNASTRLNAFWCRRQGSKEEREEATKLSLLPCHGSLAL